MDGRPFREYIDNTRKIIFKHPFTDITLYVYDMDEESLLNL